MFICGICEKPSAPGEAATFVVTAKRRKNYPVRTDGDGNIIDNGGTGYETVREIKAHASCAKALQEAKAGG